MGVNKREDLKKYGFNKVPFSKQTPPAASLFLQELRLVTYANNSWKKGVLCLNILDLCRIFFFVQRTFMKKYL